MKGIIMLGSNKIKIQTLKLKIKKTSVDRLYVPCTNEMVHAAC